MQPLADAPRENLARVRFVLTDMDETLTHRGRLAAATYAALERLRDAGVTVIVVTAAPAGWADQMARMWPLDGVIAENGGVFFARDDRGGLRRWFWHGDDAGAARAELERIGAAILRDHAFARLADDQSFRLTSLAFALPQARDQRDILLAALRAAGARATENNLWALGWLGAYEKLASARRVLAAFFGLDIERERDAVLYSGNSLNDAPMFSFFDHTVGVSTVRDSLPDLPKPPRWITKGPGGARDFARSRRPCWRPGTCRSRLHSLVFL